MRRLGRAILMGVWFTLMLPVSGCSPDIIVPDNAWLIYTKESMGCLEGQTIRTNLKQQLAGKEIETVRIEEVKNPEDSSNRNELVLSFPAQRISGLAGYYLIRMSCHSSREQSAKLLVGRCYIQKSSKQWQLVIQVKSDGWAAIQMLYSRNPTLQNGWYSYPENGVAPRLVKFFNAYPVPGEFKGVTQTLNMDQWSSITFEFDAPVYRRMQQVDRCQQLLQELCRTFALPGKDYIWNRELVAREEVAQTASALLPNHHFQVLLRLDDGTQLQTGGDDFIPQLRQKIALENRDKTLIGAELWLEVD